MRINDGSDVVDDAQDGSAEFEECFDVCKVGGKMVTARALLMLMVLIV